jgi:hypothetical protein
VPRLKDVALTLVLVSLGVPVFGDNPRSVVLGGDESLQIDSLSPIIGLLEDPGGALDVTAVSTEPVAGQFVSGATEKTNNGDKRTAGWVLYRVINA